MANRVNPPKQLVLPPSIASNVELKKAFDDRDFILFQLWKRTGGGNDDVADAIQASEVDTTVSVNQAQIFNLKSRIDESNDRIEDVEIDLATRPRISDIAKTNQRVNELIDELIKEIRAIAPDIERENKALCIQIETLQQLKLLNLRTEEGLETELDEDDL